MDNNTKNAFAAMQSDFAEASASAGGSVWPDEGEHECFVDGIEIDTDSTYRMGQEEIPGITISFTYTLCNDPDRESPLTFRGARFDLPLDPSRITADNQKTRYRITMERLKGHLTTLLGRSDIDDFGGAVSEVEQMLGGSTAVIAKVFCQYRKANNGKTYKTEFIRERLSA